MSTTNLDKMKTVAKMVRSGKLTKRQLDAIYKGIAKETGFSIQDVRNVVQASLLVG